MTTWRLCAAVMLLGCPSLASAAADILIADFEGRDYGAWQVTGTAFGTGPARGTLPNQMPVTGYFGEGLVNSYVGGDGSEGTLTSPEFKIARRRINFLVGGGHHPGKACLNLLVDGKTVHTATGRDSEHLLWHSWDVQDFAGRLARIEIVDRVTGGWGHILVDQIVQSDEAPRIVDERDDLLARAAASAKAAAERVKNDPDRPVYHVLPQANWNNDPNGPLFWKGYYHLFYQYNPYGDQWGHMHWGHVRSKDLAHWEHLPIALWPSLSLGEDHVFSGCATVTPKGEVMLIYTSIGSRLPEQWAAIPEDADLIRWKKHPDNPILTQQLHGNVKVHEWRDPFVFHHGEKTYLVLGGNLNGSKGGQAVVNVYRAENEELTRWRYLGVLFTHPDASVKNVECPLFFPLGEKWVLITSQGNPVHYFVGDLDGKMMRFKAEQRGIMDWGNYYAPNCTADGKGRRILWGWVTGFQGGKGWNGCMTLPRVLTLAPNHTLQQRPAPELAKLRGSRHAETDVQVQGLHRLKGIQGDALEIQTEIEPGNAKAVGIRVRCSEDGKKGVTVRFDGKQLDVAGRAVPFLLAQGEKTLRLHVFVDHSVLEVYANDRECMTRVIQAAAEQHGVEVFAEGGTAKVNELVSWPLGMIWGN